MFDIEGKERVEQNEVYDYFLEMAQNDITASGEDNRANAESWFRRDMIEGRKWFKGTMTPNALLQAHVNPSSGWLKKFSCKCHPVNYSCGKCVNDPDVLFSHYVQSHRQVWTKMDGSRFLDDDNRHRVQIEDMSRQSDSILTTRLIVHETREHWYGIPAGSTVVRDGNHRLAAILHSGLKCFVPVYYGVLV